MKPAKLGLTSPRAADDLAELGFDTEELAYTLAGAADPDLALNNAYRLHDALDSWAPLLDELTSNPVFRTRFFALLGGSTALSDHLIANPEQWRLLCDDIPDRPAMFRTMLAAVGVDADAPGLYRASDGEVVAAKQALRTAHRNLVMQVAAADLAGTFAAVKGFGDGEPMTYAYTTDRLTDLADAALTAALAVAMRDVYGDDEFDAELAVIAMGKCGARELNYISDVDVVYVHDIVDPFGGEDGHEPIDDDRAAVLATALASQLADNEARIVEELAVVQGKPADIGGYYRPDPEKAAAAMRPSATLNAIIDGM